MLYEVNFVVQFPRSISFFSLGNPKCSYNFVKGHGTNALKLQTCTVDLMTQMKACICVPVGFCASSCFSPFKVHNSPKCLGSVYHCYRSISLFFSDQEEIQIYGHEIKKNGIR